MVKQRGVLGLAIWFLLGSALLHILAPLVGGLSFEALGLLFFGIVYALASIGLNRGWRWLAWLTFLVMLFGGIAALGFASGPSLVPAWWYTLIVIADWCCAAMLFGYLWKSRPAEAST